MDSYRPQTKFVKVMFSRVSVCPQGGDEAEPPGQTPPPWADTPTRQTPSGQTPHHHPGQTPTWARIPPGHTHPLGTPPQCMLEYSQQAGSMHPTGMHSCSYSFHRPQTKFGAR